MLIERIPFNIGTLDLATYGGWPVGRSTLIYGRPKTSKTTVAYHALASFQEHNNNSIAAIFASEGKDDVEYAEGIGVDEKKVEVNPIDYAEVTLDLILDIARDIEKYGHIGFVFIDSLRTLPAQQRIEESLAKSDFGIEAKIINKFYTELAILQAKRRAVNKPLTLFATNHETEGHAAAPGIPPPVVIPRGKAQLYGSHLRIRLRNPTYVGSATVGTLKIPFQLECRFIVECNLGGPSKAEGEYRIYQVPFSSFQPGEIDELDFWWTQGRNVGYITGAGKSWSLNDGKEERQFTSKSEIFDYWKANKNFYKKDKSLMLPLVIQFFKEATTIYSKNKKGDATNNE